MKTLFLYAIVLAFCVSAHAQINPAATPPELPLGNIELLDGYTHNRRQGVDSMVGDISKPNGMTIRYDIGRANGLYVDKCISANECVWYKRRKANGREVWLSLTKSGQIYATFPKEQANFYAQTQTPEDIADFLIMILTYKVKEPFVEKAAEKPKQK